MFEFLRADREDKKVYTVSPTPNKHGNSVIIFNLSTSAQQDWKINVLRGCVSASQVEVDYLFNLLTDILNERQVKVH